KRVFLVILFTSFSGSLVSRIPGAVQLFPLFQDTGVRLSNIHFELNGGTFSYSSEGHIYASR
nr:hypothetical protein [Escherichia coli]